MFLAQCPHSEEDILIQSDTVTDTLGWLSDSPGVSLQCPARIKTKTHKDITPGGLSAVAGLPGSGETQAIISIGESHLYPASLTHQRAAPSGDKEEAGETGDKSCVQKLLS